MESDGPPRLIGPSSDNESMGESELPMMINNMNLRGSQPRFRPRQSRNSPTRSPPRIRTYHQEEASENDEEEERGPPRERAVPPPPVEEEEGKNANISEYKPLETMAWFYDDNEVPQEDKWESYTPEEKENFKRTGNDFCYLCMEKAVTPSLSRITIEKNFMRMIFNREAEPAHIIKAIKKVYIKHIRPTLKGAMAQPWTERQIWNHVRLHIDSEIVNNIEAQRTMLGVSDYYQKRMRVRKAGTEDEYELNESALEAWYNNRRELEKTQKAYSSLLLRRKEQ